DSDDFVEPDMLEQLYCKATETDADIVWCDWWLSFAKNERYMKQPEYRTPVEALKGMLSGVMKFNVWNKLVKRKLYTDSNITFPAGCGMGEDMTMMRLFARAEKVTYLPKAFYHYVQLNTSAFSKTYSNRHLEELQHNVSLLLSDLQRLFGDQLKREMAFFQLDVKFPFLITDDFSKYKLWQSWYPEANQYILQNKQLSWRSRCLQWLAWKHQFWAVWLYYKCVHKIIYGLIYR
ncbi:MAG: glycosyltransferase family 2 protein, partial [Parabacteroides sp.]|nr:glycosyltransferase family 2 protein [Parabacteroides sp.]